MKCRRRRLDFPFRVDSTSSAMNVLISCHTDQANIREQLPRAFAVIDESTPDSLSARANLVRWCDVFVVIISRAYQRTPFCMETINYAKDVRKPVIAVLAEPEFQPYGALGAICASAIRYLVLDRDGISQNVVAELSNAISAQQSKKKSTKGVIDPAQVRFGQRIDRRRTNISLAEGGGASSSCHPWQEPVQGPRCFDRGWFKDRPAGLQ